MITGANGGLGFAAARALANRGTTVVLAARDVAKANAARNAIRREFPDANLDVVPLDLASLTSVRTAAETIGARYACLDILINNAGVMGVPEQSTADGFEMQFGVDHLGHFALTGRLLAHLAAAPAGRVVTVTSFARFVGRTVDPENPHLHGRYDPWRAYGQAKQANLVFAAELDHRLVAADSSVRSVAAHPGLSHTGLQVRSVTESAGGRAQRFWDRAARRFGMPPAVATASIVRAATDTGGRGGELYGPRWVTFGPPVRRPILRAGRHAGRILWDVSEREIGEVVDVAAITNVS
ncbi:MAG: SDR family NAD(P)-dependent oxidoreductase [Nitriliruptoraceae bacterium]